MSSPWPEGPVDLLGIIHYLPNDQALKYAFIV